MAVGKQQARRVGGSRSNGDVKISLKSLIIGVVFGVCCFYGGVLVGARTVAPSETECLKYRHLFEGGHSGAAQQPCAQNIPVLADPQSNNCLPCPLADNCPPCEACPPPSPDQCPPPEKCPPSEPCKCNNTPEQAAAAEEFIKNHSEDAERFGPGVASFAVGMAALPRDSFNKQFDVGVPYDVNGKQNHQVILLYGHNEALPKSNTIFSQLAKSNTAIPETDDIDMATENCDILNVILTQPGEKRQCVAFLGQFKSYHIQKFMRLPEKEGEKLNPKAPLRLVNRGAQSSGRLSAKVPTPEESSTYRDILTNYFRHLEAVLEQLKPLAEKVAQRNTVVVMICNLGQSELLINFVCSARSHGLDTSSILVFATDEETLDLATGLGLTAFYDEVNYKNIPKEAAGRYADATFTAMMMAKVYCVHQISQLGYDILFQDVDIVWYRNPLEYFHDSVKETDHDIYFQDDGSRGLFYAPYSSNTGFYYVRNNHKTQYFFNALLYGGDLIVSTHSHQIALVSVLSEHASLYGLRIKIFNRIEDDFPGGHAFHTRTQFMKDLFKGTVKPYIFHMSWTKNKKNKAKFMRQIGAWYTNDKCIQTTAQEILETKDSVASGSLITPCCSAEPQISCFYKDKPSIQRCDDSPTLDYGKPSFW